MLCSHLVSGEEPDWEKVVRKDPSQRDLPKIKPGLDGKALERAVHYSFKEGLCIAVVEVKNGITFAPTIGPDGTRCTAGLDSKILLKGNKEFGFDFTVGQIVHLYPVASAERVILLHGASGNWIPYSETTEQIIVKYLEKLNKAKPGKDVDDNDKRKNDRKKD